MVCIRGFLYLVKDVMLHFLFVFNRRLGGYEVGANLRAVLLGVHVVAMLRLLSFAWKELGHVFLIGNKESLLNV